MRITMSPEALARYTDPATSKKAAAKFRPGSINSLILDALRENEIQYQAVLMRPSERGLNGQQLAAKIDKPLNSVTPRFKGLLEAGLIKHRKASGDLYERDGQYVWLIAEATSD